MAELIHPRNADLQLANDATNLPDDQAAYSGRRFTISHTEKDVWGPLHPHNNSIKRNGPSRRARGRPQIDLDPRTERGLIRLFVSSGTSIERMAKAITKSGQSKRLLLRDRLEKLTGAGPDSDTPLGQLRLPEKSAKKCNKREEGAADSHSFHGCCEKCGRASQEPVHQDANATSSRGNTSPEDCLSENTPDHTTFNYFHDTYGSQSTLESQGGTPFPFSDYLVLDSPLYTNLESMDSEQVDLGGTDLNQQPPSRPLTSSSSVLSISPNSIGLDADEQIQNSSGAASKSESRHESPFRSLTGIVRELDRGRAGTSHHFAKCCSISASTIASRSSSVNTECMFRTSGSEFVEYYNKPRIDHGTPSTAESDAPTAESSSAPSTGVTPFVVGCIIQARIDDLEDDKLKEQLETNFSITEPGSVQNLVNESDHRGVTALHLCVAYGLLETCGFLMESGANHEACTHKGTCINHFAKPAEKLAGDYDRSLYFRIKHCRRHVKNGFIPRVPKPSPRPKKRGRDMQDPECSIPIADLQPSGSSIEQAQVANSLPFGSTTSPETPLGTAEDAVEFAATRPQYTRDLTNSPAPTVHGGPSNTDTQDFAKSSSMRRKMFRQNLGRDSPPPIGAPHHAQTVQVPSSPLDYGDNLDRAFSYGDISPRQQDADCTFDFTGQAAEYLTSTVFDTSLVMQPSTDYQGAQGEAEDFPCGPDPDRQYPSQQPTQDFEQPVVPSSGANVSQDFFFPPVSGQGNENMSLASGQMHDGPPTEYWHCEHGTPRNYEISHCPYCPKL